MSNQFIGEIRLFGGNFAPINWHFCDGTLIPISENSVLFALIGTTYGGDGVNTYALPDLRGRVPIHQGTGAGLSTRVIGEKGGTNSVTLTSNNLPQHTHTLSATTAAATALAPSPSLTFAQTTSAFRSYTNVNPGDPITETDFAVNSVTTTGNGLPHENMMPYLGVNYIIALYGIFPTRN